MLINLNYLIESNVTEEVDLEMIEPVSAVGMTFVGTSGYDRIDGTNGNDIIYGLDGPDRLFGRDGDDDIFGGGSNDRIFGGNGNDYIDGGDGNDGLLGGNGNDVILGGNGKDRLSGGEGKDRLDGGDGEDILIGGCGNDILTGGKGEDVFRFVNDRRWDDDVITDFQDGVDLISFEGCQKSIKFQDLQIHDTSRGAVIEYDGNTILLENVSASLINEHDFIF